jgi:deoxyribodipyrimidine photo-lyase
MQASLKLSSQVEPDVIVAQSSLGTHPMAANKRNRHMTFYFEPTRSAGLTKLNTFIANAGRHYQNSRNSDFGPDDRSNVSALSPYIRHRMLTEEEVLQTVLAKHSPIAAEKFIQEVFWRTYFKGHLETRPTVWDNYRTKLREVKLSGGLATAYDSAVSANTGIECFDAWVDELVEYGYLHNHARMWFASIWIFTLRLPWVLGADFMFRHLLDGDPASNTLSWRWVAGLHTKGKTYLARADNIETYTQGRFKPRGLAQQAPALEEAEAHPLRKLPSAMSCFPEGKVGLLITEEDFHPESFDARQSQIIAVAGATSVAQRSHFQVGDHVHYFTTNALADTLTRAAKKHKCAALQLPNLTVEEVALFAEQHGIQKLVTSYAPVGPVAEQLSILTTGLSARGIELVQVRRAFDSHAWPHGSKGFFAMKEKIPSFVEKLT